MCGGGVWWVWSQIFLLLYCQGVKCGYNIYYCIISPLSMAQQGNTLTVTSTTHWLWQPSRHHYWLTVKPVMCLITLIFNDWLYYYYEFKVFQIPFVRATLINNMDVALLRFCLSHLDSFLLGGCWFFFPSFVVVVVVVVVHGHYLIVQLD